MDHRRCVTSEIQSIGAYATNPAGGLPKGPDAQTSVKKVSCALDYASSGKKIDFGGASSHSSLLQVKRAGAPQTTRHSTN